ncbi:SixA phosphatase family protein [Pengzhenrongella sicca]|uniref:Histidine phosphatase family protein n=1 Tax=Pengzhenrongella sicca TaxID=2819238 RepID=A0A8A4Z8B1_9MICO|nr:histidine phosphatase family protein [Pengzhenrongella sicca]QTE28102.1 histidine phosphatase family protein [Pengzhenrongella sicca]
MILVRHAHAGTKASWHRDDGLRPLSRCGHAQAVSLVVALAGDRVDTLWASPTVRCQQSLAPLARARGMRVQDAGLLAKDTQVDRLLQWLLDHEQAPWVLCTHGEVFAALLVAGRSAGVITTEVRVTEKGGAWRVTRDFDRPVHLEYLPPSPRH